LNVGEKGVIQRIWPETGPLLEHLSERGLRPGTEVEVLAIDPFDRQRSLRVGGRRVSLGREATERITVRVKRSKR
jgi:Fe2+ transport system protein FeoA